MGIHQDSSRLTETTPLSVRTVAKCCILPVDPLVTFLAEATRPGKIIVADQRRSAKVSRPAPVHRRSPGDAPPIDAPTLTDLVGPDKVADSAPFFSFLAGRYVQNSFGEKLLQHGSEAWVALRAPWLARR